MSTAKTVSYFRTHIVPAYAGLDALSRNKIISFLAGIATAHMVNVPITSDADCRDRFMGARSNQIKGKILAAFKWGQVNITEAYFDAGLNLAWHVLYDVVYSPIDKRLQHQASVFTFGIEDNQDLYIDLIIKTINHLNYEYHNGCTGKYIASLWGKEITLGQFEQLNDVARKDLFSSYFGIALGYYLDLPSSDVNSASSFFEAAHRGFVGNIASAVNESVQLNLDIVLKTAKTIWLHRASVIAREFPTIMVLSKIANPFNDTVPKKFTEEGWLPKIMDCADLFETMVSEINSMQDPDVIDAHDLTGMSALAQN